MLDRRAGRPRDGMAELLAGLEHVPLRGGLSGSVRHVHWARGAPTRVLVTADHGTSSVTGAHMTGPVPVLWGVWPTDGEPDVFDEESAAHGALGQVTPLELHELVGASAKR